MSDYTEFSDVTGGDFNLAPLAAGLCRGVYLTQLGTTAGIEVTQAEVDAARAAGMGLIGYDQTPSLELFAAGGSVFGIPCAVADVEPYAGTESAAHTAVAARQARGEASVIYISRGNWASMRADLASPQGVAYVIADWSMSLAQAQAFIAANPDVVGVQFGDPSSNPNTLVPGTGVTLAMSNQDIDVGRTSWLSSFLPGAAPTPPPAANAPAWPFGPADYLGQPSADPHCHSGYYSSVDNHIVALWQQRMKDRGWAIQVDGRFWEQSAGVCLAFQRDSTAHGWYLKDDGIVGTNTWKASWLRPISH